MSNVASSVLSKALETTVFYAGRLFTELTKVLPHLTLPQEPQENTIKQYEVSQSRQYGVAVGDVANAQMALMRAFLSLEHNQQPYLSSLHCGKSQAYRLTWQQEHIQI